MACLQVDATPVEDVISETKATTNEPQVVAPTPPPPPPPAETVRTVDMDDEEDLEALTYQEKAENSENEEEKDIEFSPFIEGEDEPPFRYDDGEAATFGDFNEGEDED